MLMKAESNMAFHLKVKCKREIGEMRRKQMHSVSETLASMSCALPYAIAAQIAYPDHQCVAFVGDDLIKRYIMSDISEN